MKNLVVWISLVVLLLLTQNVCDCEPFADMIGTIAGLTSMHSHLKGMTNDDRMMNRLPDMLLTSVTDQLHYWKKSFLDAFRNPIVNQNFEKLIQATSQIEDFYADMKSADESTTHLNATDRTIQESKSNLLPRRHRPIGLMRYVHNYLNSEGANNILDSLKHQPLRDYSGTCSTTETEDPISKHLLDFMSMIVATELKVFLTIRMAARILKIGDADWVTANGILEEYHKSLMIRFKDVIASASRDVWRCDPMEHVESITYTKLNNVFRKFVVKENLLLGKDRCGGDCRAEHPQNATYCSHDEQSKNPTSTKTYKISEEVCTHQRVCEGLLQDCDSGFDMNTIDILNVYLSPSRNRRYECIKLLTRQKHYGLECPTRIPLSMEQSHYYFNTCDVCLCTCEEYPSRETNYQPTERFFYRGAVFADTKNNYVITGARIAKKDGIVFIQIQQGKLQQQCSIDASSVSWKIAPSNLNDSFHHITMRWTGVRSIGLEVTDVPHGHVLVGLKMDVFYIYEIRRIRLSVYSLPVDYTNGCTILSSVKPSETMSSPPESALDLTEKHLPDPRARSNSIVSDKYLTFTTSSMYSDVGQTTIPLLDIQNVITRTPLPMSGAGFYFKYTGDYQGYLGLKLKVYDLSLNLKMHNNNMSNTTL